MKKLFIIAMVAVAALAVSCERVFIPGKITDEPFIEFKEESVAVEPGGGEMVIPVTSTGVSNVEIEFQHGDNWEVDPENGDLTPKDGWIKLVTVIDQYDDATRALAKWDSGISIEVEPNHTGYERRAWITVTSFTKSDRILVVQYPGSFGPEE